MQVYAGRPALQTPEQVDRRFGVVAGLYVATLVAPALSFVTVRTLSVESELLALCLVGATGAALTSLVASLVTHRSRVVAWFESSWVAVLVPAVGLLPLVLYAFSAFLYLAFLVSPLQSETAVSLVGFIGFWSGLVASCLGSALVVMARTRVATATIEDGDVDIEWSAGWPRQQRLVLGFATVLVCVAVAGLVFWYVPQATFVVLSTFAVLAITVRSVTVTWSYRVTPAGIERRRVTPVTTVRHLVPWTRFDGFSVTDSALVLHRPRPHLDVRCARWDIELDTDESDVFAALGEYLDRQER